MKKVTVLCLSLLLLSGCGAAKTEEAPAAEMPTAETTTTSTANPTAKPTEAPQPTPEPTPEPTIEVDEGLLTVTIIVPAEYLSGKTQADLDAEREEHGYISEVLNNDGSATVVMTKKQHRELMASLAETIEDGMNSFVESADYPDIVAVEAGENYASFTVTLNTDKLDINDTFAAWSLYMYGGLYNAYIEDGAESIHVKYINTAGDVLYEADSSELKF